MLLWITFFVCLVLVTIVWDVYRRKRFDKKVISGKDKTEGNSWVWFVLALVFGIAAIWMFFDPPGPPWGGRGGWFYGIANHWLGQYGPAILNFVFSFWFFYEGWKRWPCD